MEKKGSLRDWFTGRETGVHLAKRLLLSGVVLLIGLLICFLLYVWVTMPDLDQEDVSPDGYRTTVLDDNREVILTLMGAESNRIYVELDGIPKHLQDAVVAIEDERFYEHPGIDLRGIVRAAYRNLTSGSLSEGASTITQQLIKNNVFADWTQEKTAMDKVRRKLQEQCLALQLERRESKDWILENYLNTINLGSGTWGVQTAAMRYFGKDVSELTLSECAVLAGITKSPVGYNPLNNPENSRERQLLVLGKMLELGMISQQEYEEAVADDVYERIARDNVPVEGAEIQSYFEDALVYQVVEDLETALGCTEEEAWSLLYRGGLTIHSTQDSQLQEICETEINREEWYTTDAQASVVMMDPYTGQVKALVGGRGEKEGSLTLNRATSSVRQPGSTIKVVGEYAAALDHGETTLGMVYDDAPHTYADGTAIRNASGTYSGRTTVRQAIVSSLNTVALKCFQNTGTDAVFSRLQQFGFSHLTEEDKVEALALGGTHGGVTNLEMTAAYSAIANGGTYLEPTYYTEILDRNGNVLLKKVPEQHTAVRASTAILLTEAMKGVMAEGTGVQAEFSGMALAGKSGTTTDLRDLWFVGYSPYYTCGVWGGYDDFSAQSSSTYVKKIWRAVMQQAHEGLVYQAFTGTETLTSSIICTKCGNLAVEGLCDDTVQGDMTREEYYVPGTEPTEPCNCHVERSYCKRSGQLAGDDCPVYQLETKVYLIKGTEGTADAEAVVPAEEETCQAHRSWWDWLIPDGAEDAETPDRPQNSEQDEPWHEDRWPSNRGKNWRDWLRF